MPYNVTSLVNNIILPATVEADIIGIERLNKIINWFILHKTDPLDLAVIYSVGGVDTLILVEDAVFIGTSKEQRGDIDVEGIAKRIEAHHNLERSTL
jgi:hypothetical protein